MIRQTFRALFAVILAAGLVAGCKSTPKEEPAPVVVPTEIVETTPPPAEPEPPPRTNASGEVLGPDGDVLSTTFYFEYDQARLAPADISVLAHHADYLRDFRNVSVSIEGHCDQRGSREYNLALGERRAQAVERYLTSAGVRSDQIDVVSYGEERLADPGENEGAWAKNRRAVVIYR